MRTPTPLATRLPRTLLALLASAVMALACLFALSPARATAAETSYLQMEATASAGTLVVRAVLYDGSSRPIAGKTLAVKATSTDGPSDAISATATTGGDGWTMSRLSLGERHGTITVRVSFAGDAQWSATSEITNLEVSADARTTITARVTAPRVAATPGESVTLTGSLTRTGGAPIKDASISATLPDGSAGEDVAVTDANGMFTMVVTVPADTPAGRFDVKLSFDGSKTLDASSVVVPVTVATPASETPSASASEQPAASASDAASSATAETLPPVATRQQQPPSRWPLVVGGAAVGALALGAGVMVVARRHHRADSDPDDFVAPAPRVLAPQHLPRRVDNEAVATTAPSDERPQPPASPRWQDAPTQPMPTVEQAASGGPQAAAAQTSPPVPAVAPTSEPRAGSRFSAAEPPADDRHGGSRFADDDADPTTPMRAFSDSPEPGLEAAPRRTIDDQPDEPAPRRARRFLD